MKAQFLHSVEPHCQAQQPVTQNVLAPVSPSATTFVLTAAPAQELNELHQLYQSRANSFWDDSLPSLPVYHLHPGIYTLRGVTWPDLQNHGLVSATLQSHFFSGISERSLRGAINNVRGEESACVAAAETLFWIHLKLWVQAKQKNPGKNTEELRDSVEEYLRQQKWFDIGGKRQYNETIEMGRRIICFLQHALKYQREDVLEKAIRFVNHLPFGFRKYPREMQARWPAIVKAFFQSPGLPNLDYTDLPWATLCQP
jgi:hypothetical protein